MKTIVKSFIGFAALAALTVNVNAQTLSGSKKSDEPVKKTATQYTPDMTVIHKGDNLVNLNLGFIGFPAPSLSYERIIVQFNDNLCLGVGATVGVYTTNIESYLDVTTRGLGIGINALGNLHLTAVRNLDLFAGLDLGATIVSATASSSYSGSKYTHTEVFFSSIPAHIGASYFFSDKFAATARLGGWGGISLGITAKF